MSQAGIISSTSAPPPPAVPTTFVTDVNSPSVPALNILNVPGGSTSANDVNGIRTDGSSGSNTLTIQLTNRLEGTGQTVGATSDDLITFALGATPGTYTFDCRIAGFDDTTPSGVGYTIVGAVRTTGAAATLLTGQAIDSFEEVATATCNAILAVSGNNAIFRVTGAAGLTIDWNAVGEYVLVT
jgi:hypothetical protein